MKTKWSESPSLQIKIKSKSVHQINNEEKKRESYETQIDAINIDRIK